MTNYRLIVKLLLAFFLTSLAGNMRAQESNAPGALTLQECIELAWKNNLALRQRNLESRRAEINKREAYQNIIPSLDAKLGHNLSYGRRIDPATNQYFNQQFTSGNQSISSSVTLFQGLGSLHNIRQQVTASKAAILEEEAAREQVMLDVILAYIQVLTARDMVAQATLRLELTEQQLKRTTDLQTVGAVSPSDYYDLKGQYAGDKNALNEVHKTYMSTRVELARLLNIPDAQNLTVVSLENFQVPDTTSEDPARLFESAAARIPLLKASRFRIEEAGFRLKAARAGYSPRLSMGAGFESTYSSNSDLGYLKQAGQNIGRYFSFNLSIPILGSLFVRNNVVRAKLLMTEAGYLSEAREVELQQQIGQVVVNLNLAKENYRNLVSQEESYAESFRIAQARFDAGDINSVIYLTSKNNMEQARAKLVIGKYELQLQQFMMEYYRGGLQWQNPARN